MSSKYFAVRPLGLRPDESARVRRAAERVATIDPAAIASMSAFVKVGRNQYAPARDEARWGDTVRGISCVIGRPVAYEIVEV